MSKTNKTMYAKKMFLLLVVFRGSIVRCPVVTVFLARTEGTGVESWDIKFLPVLGGNIVDLLACVEHGSKLLFDCLVKPAKKYSVSVTDILSLWCVTKEEVYCKYCNWAVRSSLRRTY